MSLCTILLLAWAALAISAIAFWYSIHLPKD